jgi:hypothetical protein
MSETGGPIIAQAQVTVTATGTTSHDLQSIQIIPSSQTLVTTGETAQFIAIGTFSGIPGTQDITDLVNWQSSDVKVATINSAGLATAIGSNTTSTITATMKDSSNAVITGTATLTFAPGGGGSVGLPTLTVYGVGQGSGKVTISTPNPPASLTCSLITAATCTGHFVLNSTITLTVVPDSGSSFGGWSANCQPATNTTCTTQMTDNATVGVIFNKP